jgi:hypothetical protein
LFSGHAPVGAIRRQVRVIALDNICAERGLDLIDLLKIDAEGYDFQVLRGAEKLLKEQKISVVQFEYNRPWANAGGTLALQATDLAEVDCEVNPERVRVRKGLLVLNLAQVRSCCDPAGTV